MKRNSNLAYLIALAGTIASLDGVSTAAGAAPSSADAAVVEVSGGTATFDIGTSISAINVHGKSVNLRARARVHRSADTMTIEQLQATLPVSTLTTGIALRDEHMKKYVFTTADGQVPDVTFAADKADCSSGKRDNAICQVSGALSIRGTARPFAMALKITKAGDAYKAAGDGTVKLSAYGIPAPSQLGVSTADEVKLHLEFTARPSSSEIASHAGGE
ncbi:MAG TPA: YceI family protein [Vicinamibacterales bacterium]|jgi:polyisoprenoid-binding protein YceI